MATHSQVTTALSAISARIAEAQDVRERSRADILRARSILAEIPTAYADVIATIDAYVPTGASETLAKDSKSKLQSEFTSLKASIEAELTALGISFT